MKKRVVLIIGLVILLIVAAIIFFLWRAGKIFTPAPPITSEVVTPELAAPQRWDELYITSNTLNWLADEMRDERGAYNSLYNCTYSLEENQWLCNNGQSSNRTGTAVIWANYLFWKKTGDSTALTRLKNDLALYANPEIVELLQTDNLSCWYMLPVINDQNSALSAVDRQNATEICNRTVYETALGTSGGGIRPLAEYQATADAYINTILSETPNLMVDSIFPNSVLAPTNNRDYVADPRADWNNYAVEILAANQLNPSDENLAWAYLYYAGILYLFVEAPESAQNLDANCQLLFTAQNFCQQGHDASCQLQTWLADQAVNLDINAQTPNLENLAKCALATTGSQKEHFMSALENFYYSEDNSSRQTQEPWLLNSNGTITKSVVENALFVGLLAGE